MKKFEDYPRYLLPREVAEILRLSLAAFYKRAWAGDIPVCKVGRGSIRVDKKKLEKYMEERSRGGTDEKHGNAL